MALQVSWQVPGYDDNRFRWKGALLHDSTVSPPSPHNLLGKLCPYYICLEVCVYLLEVDFLVCLHNWLLSLSPFFTGSSVAE